jgi:hypothetical protein
LIIETGQPPDRIKRFRKTLSKAKDSAGKQKLSYPGKNSNLQKVTNQYLDWFEHSNAPLPKENLFIGIKSD